VSNTIDDYELVNCLQTGNVSQIWEVKQVSSGQSFAMKILLPETLKEAEFRNSLKHEAKVGKSLEHPNIVKIFDLKMSKQNGYFIMEYFRAPNLKSMIRNDLTSAQVRAKRIMECVSQALAHMHEKGWVHRDIKPDNILVNKGSEVRLIDFGLSAPPKSLVGRILHSKKRTIIPGTRTYLAPEMIERKPLSVSSDIYSLGITFYEMLTGRPPFISGNPNELLMMQVRDRPEKPSGYNDNVSPECDLFVMSMLEKKPANRPKSMQEIFAAVRNLRFYKTEADEAARIKALAAEDNFAKSVGARLESRVDAMRTPEERAAAAEEAKKIAAAMKQKRAAAEKGIAKEKSKGQPAAPAQAPAPAMQPMQPMMPGYPMPGMPMPGMPMPGMPYGQPGFPPQGYPQPGFAPMPGMPYPGGPYPGAPMPGQMPMPAAPGAMPPQQPRPAAPAAPKPKSAPPPPAKRPPAPDPDDIPLMEELPDVM
jgi:serine/threonine-protein kinase